MKHFLGLVFMFCVIGGVFAALDKSPPPAPRHTSVDPVVWVGAIRPFVAPWTMEIWRRYDDAVVIFSHGDDRGGRWVFVPDAPYAVEPVVDAIARLRKVPWIGDRRIVIVACNPGCYELPPSCGNVVYCRTGDVRFGPDHLILREAGFVGTGNIYEFKEVAPGR